MGGICINFLFYIFICDIKLKMVYIIDKDGKYFLNLIMDKLGIFVFYSLGYNVINDIFWVGSKNCNWFCVYFYRFK